MVEGVRSTNLIALQRERNNNAQNSITTSHPKIDNRLQNDVVELSAKQGVKNRFSNLSTTQKICIGGVVAAAIGTLAFVLTRGRVGAVQFKQLAEHIEFKKAKTFEEAVEFGQKHLGIKQYEGFTAKDTEVINWINEGLVNVSNYQKGKLKMPDFVRYAEKEKETTRAFVFRQGNHYRNILAINKTFIKNIDKVISEYKGINEECLKRFNPESVKDVVSNMEKFKAKKLNLNGKMKLLDDLQKLDTEWVKSPEIKIKEILNNADARKKLESLGILQGNEIEYMKGLPKINLDELDKCYVPTLARISGIMCEKTGYKFVHENASPFRSIYHEIGHLQFKPIGKPRKEGKLHILESLEKYWDNDEKAFFTARQVSEYATTSPCEFVAETYAEKVSGHKLSDEVLNLYEKYTKGK